jgi:2-dehydro-3-deoxyphosphogluconate aldolase/(4S)-4-hydroxy-2-oxoglutarate aldolase
MAVPEFDLAVFQKEPVMGILRGVTEDSLDGVMETAISSGLKFLEITWNTPRADFLLYKAAQKYSDQISLGAGTIRSVEDAQTALDSGAEFLVSPGLNEQVASFCRDKSTAYFPGALTPTEIDSAWNMGATMVKVFPASQFGPDYFKLIKGPLQDVKLMAVGGVGPGNIEQYLQSGADAVALGGSVFSVKRMQNKEFLSIGKDIEEFLLAVRKFYSKIADNALSGS